MEIPATQLLKVAKMKYLIFLSFFVFAIVCVNAFPKKLHGDAKLSIKEKLKLYRARLSQKYGSDSTIPKVILASQGEIMKKITVLGDENERRKFE